MKNIITEMKNTSAGISRLDEAEDSIRDLEYKVAENTQSEQRGGRIFFFFNKDSLRDLWDNIKHFNISIIVVPEKRRKSKGLKTYLKK